jgi:hypothetical protein
LTGQESNYFELIEAGGKNLFIGYQNYSKKAVFTSNQTKHPNNKVTTNYDVNRKPKKLTILSGTLMSASPKNYGLHKVIH